MLSIRNLSFQHHCAERPALQNVSLEVKPGMFLGIVGPSGSGKSTLLRSMNGLIPHFHGGKFGGTVEVQGQDSRKIGTAELSRVIGFVSQEPETQTVFDTVLDEIAFGPENLGVPGNEIECRVANALKTLQIDHLAERDLTTLSGGERQRVVIAATLAMGSRILILDEPLSQLDPWASKDLLKALDELRETSQVGIVVAEHRIDQLLPNCTHILELESGGSVHGVQTRSSAMQTMKNPATIVRIARACGWPVLPESTEEARSMQQEFGRQFTIPSWENNEIGAVQLDARNISILRSGQRLLSDIDVQLHAGEIQALIGPNGSGKTTLLRTLAGLETPDSGIAKLDGVSTYQLSGARRLRSIGYVPQYPAALFLGETVREEIEITLSRARSDRTITELLDAFYLNSLADRFSWDISGGERQRLAIAIAVAAGPRVLLLDEPTRGMDHDARQHLIDLLDRLRRSGISILIATHDMEFVATSATCVTRLYKGEIVARGLTADVIGGDPILQTDVARVFGAGFLTCGQIESAVASAGPVLRKPSGADQPAKVNVRT